MVKILLVEDNEINRDMLTRRLDRQGFSVCCAVDGASGVAMASSEMPDLILMDVVMPGQNGFQLTRAINRTPEFADVPIIICTSKNLETDRVWGMRQGAKDSVMKPVSADELLSKINTLAEA